MKKIKFVAIILVMAIMIVGVGYAYWQEELKINSTVTTGELDVDFEPLVIDIDADDSWWYGDDYVDIDADVVDSGSRITFEIDKMYPGSGGYLRFLIKNNGTVPARLTEVELANVVDDDDLEGQLEYRVNSLWIVKKGFLLPIIDPESPPLVADSLEDLADKLSDVMDEHILEPGDYFNLNWGDRYDIIAETCGYNIVLPASVDDDEYENATLKFDLNLKFQQGE